MVVTRWHTFALGLLLGILPGAIIVWRLTHRTGELEPRAEKYDRICQAVRVSLETDIRVIGEPNWERLLDRVGTDRGDDSAAMLDRCLPYPFPQEEFNACLKNADRQCARDILARAVTFVGQL